MIDTVAQLLESEVAAKVRKKTLEFVFKNPPPRADDHYTRDQFAKWAERFTKHLNDTPLE